MEPLRHAAHDLTRRGLAAIDLVHQVADMISEAEKRNKTLLVRTMEQLKTVENRNCALEARAIEAEVSACEAEKWLTRLHDKIENDLVGKQRRGLNYSMKKQEDDVLEGLSVFAIKHGEVGPDPNREDYCSHAKNHSSMLRLTT